MDEILYTALVEVTMTRVKEPDPTTGEIPDYKSPPARIIRSLRQGYDNVRRQRDERSKKIIALQGKERDLHESREEWKARTKAAEARIKELEKKRLPTGSQSGSQPTPLPWLPLYGS